MGDKMPSWTDGLQAESNLPTDDFTWTTGGNGGLDGFSFDTPYNEGVLDSARLPQAHGLSELPDGVLSAEFAGFSMTDDPDALMQVDSFDLGGMLDEGNVYASKKDKKLASIVDLTWLDPTQKQDPARLPKELRPDEPPLDSVSVLESKWKAASGFRLIPNVNKEAAEYEAKLKLGSTSHTSAEMIRDAILRAIRRSHYGHPLQDIKAEIVATLGHDAVHTRKAMAVIETEHGLAGTVFVRASAFPGLKNGKWADKLKRIARTARYVITADQTVADKLGMHRVDTVPWKAAMRHYGAMLTAAGYQLTEGTPQQVLKRAFLSGPARAVVPESHKPVDVRPADRVTTAQAVSAFSVTPQTPQEVVASPDQRLAAEKRVRAMLQVAKWVKAGKLTHEDALRLRASKADAVAIVQAAEALIAAVQQARTYDGEGKDIKAMRQAAWKSLAAKEAELEISQKKKVGVFLTRMVRLGFLTQEEVQRISALGKSADETEKLAAAAVHLAAQHRKLVLPTKVVKGYAGVKYEAVGMTHKAMGPAKAEIEAAQREKLKTYLQKAVKVGSLRAEDAERLLAAHKDAESIRQAMVALVAGSQNKGREYEGVGKGASVMRQASAGPKPLPEVSTQDRLIQKAAAKSGIRVGEFQSMIRWARRQMSEGWAGTDFDSLLGARWSQPLLKAASKILRNLRAEYEGVSGHLYVDAAAYASQHGTKGCDEGALQHRANQIKYVKAMDRCAGCSFARQLQDGSMVCSNYRKTIVSEIPTAELKAFQQESLRLANGSDADRTAAMFDPGEYNLTSPMDESLSLASSSSAEELGAILFGGMQVE